MNQIETCYKVSNSILENIAATATFPVVLKQQVADWPAVAAATQGFGELRSYLSQFDKEQALLVFAADAKYQGRVFYNEDFSDVNFSRQHATLNQFLRQIEQCKEQDNSPTLYMGSTNVMKGLPGFREQNTLSFGVSAGNVVMNSWMGNQSHVAAHFDYPNNFACNVAGTRTFTLFPPEQLENLYIGPLEHNPAGPAISLVNPLDPDLSKHPKYSEALQNAWQATLEPGDVLFIPGMWWHQVSAHSDFNMLINYWWKKAPGYLPSPVQALNLALLTIKDLSAEQKSAWNNLFQYYVFGSDTFEHIPENIKGILGDIDEQQARKIRAQLLNALNR